MVKVKIGHGWLEGSEHVDKVSGQNYLSFKGIPYAKPPIGNLRFKAPQPLQPWTGIKDATKHGPVCSQYNAFKKLLVPGSEDCLYLNVYTRCLTLKLPVMVWIHGGGFMAGFGDSQNFGPDFLIHNDVVLVTFNYRLEVLGFLCLENEKVPGNAGMKDQVAVLRWVKENIEHFGGDPNNVTVFGESAGSASVGYHLISSMSKGLFHKAIMQSGSITCDWAHGSFMKRRGFLIGKRIGLETNDVDELYDFLLSQPVEKLVNHFPLPIAGVESIQTGFYLYMNPVVEKNYDNEEAFLTKTPIEYLKAGEIQDVPLIVGYTSEDGLEMITRIEDTINALNIFPEFLLPVQFSWKFNVNEIFELSETVKQFYFCNKYITEENMNDVIKFATCYHFKYHNYRFLQYFQKNCSSNVYNYIFTAVTERNVCASGIKAPVTENVACHADDLRYLFDYAVLPVDRSSKSWDIISNMCKLWTNFAKQSNPTPSSELGVIWKPYSTKFRNILNIGTELKPMLCDDEEEIQLWNELFALYDKRN